MQNRMATRKKNRMACNPLGGLALLQRRSQAKLEEDHIRGILLAYHGALTGLRTGYGSEALWTTAAYSLNIAMVLAELGVRPEALQIVKDAQLAMIRIRDTALQTGEWSLGAGTFIVNCAFKLHDQQLDEATLFQLRTAREEVHRRMEAGEHL